MNKEFYRFEQGENTLEFNTSVAPKPIVSEFGNRIAIDAKANGKDYIVTMNPSGILYELLVQQFKKGKSKITIIRTGEGMKTRYAVK